MLDDGDRHVSRTLLAFVTTALDSPDTTADAAFRRAARLAAADDDFRFPPDVLAELADAPHPSLLLLRVAETAARRPPSMSPRALFARQLGGKAASPSASPAARVTLLDDPGLFWVTDPATEVPERSFALEHVRARSRWRVVPVVRGRGH